MAVFRCAMAALVLTASGSAYAADWKVAGLAMGEGNRGVTYVDTASIRPKGDTIEFRSEQYLEHGAIGYDRISALSKVDCETMTVTLLREGLYKGKALVAFGATPRELNYYASANSNHWVLRNVCDRSFLSKTVANHGRDSRRLFDLEWSRVPDRLAVTMPVAAKTRVAAQGAGVAAVVATPRP